MRSSLDNQSPISDTPQRLLEKGTSARYRDFSTARNLEEMSSVVLSRSELDRMRQSVLPPVENRKNTERKEELRKKSQVCMSLLHSIH